MTTEQIFEAFKILKSKGAKNFGIHAFLASNTVTNEYYPTLAKTLFEVAVKLKEETGAHIIPIMSETAYSTDTRFGACVDFRHQLEEITGEKILHTVFETEPIGPKKLLDALIIAPCTGNTLAKLAYGIADSAVTLAVKAHLRNERPVVLAVSTNDGLTGNSKNIGTLLNTKGYFFVPFGQDDPIKKEASLVANMEAIPETVAAVFEGKQIQPILL